MKAIRAFAPATVANVAVGFDSLGFAVDTLGDIVEVARIPEVGRVEIEKILNDVEITYDPRKNTATIGLIKLCEERKLSFGFRVRIEKGIPLSSGLGGSAASAVAALVAANEFIRPKLTKEEIMRYALEGEAFASGSRHGDNLAPSLYGGLVLVRSMDPIDWVPLPFFSRLHCVLVHPQLRVETKAARGILKGELSLKTHILQSANFAAFVASCFSEDLPLMQRSLQDLLIEPQRAPLIPGFFEVKAAALSEGALACSISGAGPTVFAFAENRKAAFRVQESMQQAFAKKGIQSEAWMSKVSKKGAFVL